MAQMAGSNVDVYFEASKHLLSMRLDGTVAGALPQDMSIDLATLRNFAIPIDWAIDSGLRHLTIHNHDKYIQIVNEAGYTLANNGAVNISMLNNRGLTSISFTDTVKLKGALQSFGSYTYDLETIDGDLDFSAVDSWTYSNWFIGSKIAHIRLIKNSAATIGTMDFSQCNYLDETSLISIANGLADTTGAHYLKLHSTRKTMLGQITGIVSEDQTGTYHIFTQDSNGPTTLQDFITNTKGWTIQ